MNTTEWIVCIDDQDELAESFWNGKIIDDHGNRSLTEATVARINKLKIEVFSNEHPPPHFRVIYAGKSNAFSIRDCTPYTAMN